MAEFLPLSSISFLAGWTCDTCAQHVVPGEKCPNPSPSYGSCIPQQSNGRLDVFYLVGGVCTGPTGGSRTNGDKSLARENLDGMCEARLSLKMMFPGFILPTILPEKDWETVGYVFFSSLQFHTESSKTQKGLKLVIFLWYCDSSCRELFAFDGHHKDLKIKLPWKKGTLGTFLFKPDSKPSGFLLQVFLSKISAAWNARFSFWWLVPAMWMRVLHTLLVSRCWAGVRRCRFMCKAYPALHNMHWSKKVLLIATWNFQLQNCIPSSKPLL